MSKVSVAKLADKLQLDETTVLDEAEDADDAKAFLSGHIIDKLQAMAALTFVLMKKAAKEEFELTKEQIKSATDDAADKKAALLRLIFDEAAALAQDSSRLSAAGCLPEPASTAPARDSLDPDRANINLEEKLGSGGFADVHPGEYRFRGDKHATAVAFKLFRGTLDQELRGQIAQEAQLGAKLRHPNLVQLYGVLEVEQGVALVLEIAGGGSLRDVLKSDKELPWPVRVAQLLGIAEGIQELHSFKPAIIHRDLKADNILLTDGLETAKVADFGIAKAAQTMRTTMKTKDAHGGGGTLAWKAPETFRDQFSKDTDMFGFGMTMFEVISRKTPFQGMGEPAIYQCLSERFTFSEYKLQKKGESAEQQKAEWLEEFPLEQRRPDLSQVEEGCPQELIELVQELWADEAEARPDAARCVEKLRALHTKLEPPPEPLRVEHFPFTWEMTEAADGTKVPKDGLFEVTPTDAEYWTVFASRPAPTECGCGQMTDGWLSKVFRIENPQLIAYFEFHKKRLVDA